MREAPDAADRRHPDSPTPAADRPTPGPAPRRRRARSVAALGLAAVLAGTGAALVPAAAAVPVGGGPGHGGPGHGGPGHGGPGHGGPGHGQVDEGLLRTWLADTYTSLDAMTDPATGLVADNIEGALDPATASAYTSPTNIGGYLWSTVVARDLGVIDADDARARLTTTIDTLQTMDRHDASGMYYNWYDPATGARVDTWPDDGAPVEHFLSSVDNGWLAAALRVVAEAEPTLADEARGLYDGMHFGVYYNPEGRPDLGVGLIRGGFWDEEPSGCSVPGNYTGGDTVYYTCHHYDTTVSETRIALYLGITDGEIPPEAYWGTYRTFPSTCDWSWQEQRPSGVTRTYDGVPVYEGVYHDGDTALVPGWGGSMFEALMPDMLVPESEWAPRSWGVNHPLVVQAQQRHGLEVAGYGYWGFSPASNPFGGYAEYGVDSLGMRSDGYLSDGETDVDAGFAGCREGTNPDPEFGDGVVTPHAAFLGLEYDPRGVVQNLTKLRDELGAYGPGGFYDAVAVRSGTVAERYLSLDQAMVVAAIGNYLDDGALRDYVTDDEMEQRLRPVLEQEVFSSAAEPVVPAVTDPAPRRPVRSIATLSGTAEPGAHLTVTGADGTPWCTAEVDADGAWTCTLATPVTQRGAHRLTAATTNDAGLTTTSDRITLVVAGRR
ncbi:glucoamylase family protein [Cellulomonas sp. NPDC058312]|uniref:glucoamylase family protein n=1 Tax=Cellulomonas sp. NPDC058312 TaxID=3346441 RepID=UPI0036DFF827